MGPTFIFLAYQEANMQNLYDTTAIGFDKFFQRLRELEAHATQTTKAITYPPYNIKRTSDNTYVIEMAVAGFGRNDIEITLEDSVLKIDGSVKRAAEDENNYVFKGIAERPFSRVFTLADTVEIKNAELINGMLRIWLDNFVEQKKTRKVEITDPADKVTEPKAPKASKVLKTSEEPEPGSYGYLSE